MSTGLWDDRYDLVRFRCDSSMSIRTCFSFFLVASLLLGLSAGSGLVAVSGSSFLKESSFGVTKSFSLDIKIYWKLYAESLTHFI